MKKRGIFKRFSEGVVVATPLELLKVYLGSTQNTEFFRHYTLPGGLRCLGMVKLGFKI